MPPPRAVRREVLDRDDCDDDLFDGEYYTNENCSPTDTRDRVN